ncbi:Quercetin 2,3-dioxygenase [compost metagenome]
MARGALTVNGQRLSVGDGMRLRNEQPIDFSAGDDAEVLLFDLRPVELPLY